jgi:hypothetical protein
MERCIIRDITAIFCLRQQLDRRRVMDGAISVVMNQPRLEEFLGLALQYFWRVYVHMPIPM